MRFVPPGHFRDAASFRDHLRGLGAELDCDLELDPAGPLAQPLRVHGRELANRFCVHPMEGWDGTPEGLPSEHTLRRWRNFGRSGAKLIWGGEAFAVQADGRANPHQLYLNPETDVVRGLERLRAELRAGHAEQGEDPDTLHVGLQLTHSGRFARPASGPPRPRVPARHPVLDARFGADLPPLLTDVELEEIGANYVRAAVAARDAGFEFVDVKCCHGYLLHELLAARERPGPYGGSFENRTRFLMDVIAGVRAAAPELAVVVRLSAGDVVPYEPGPDDGVGVPAAGGPYTSGFGVDEGAPTRFDHTEPIRLLGALADLGVELVNLTVGSPYYCPHLQRPAAYPPSDGYLPPEDPLCSVARQLDVVRACRRALPRLKLVGSGYSYLQEWLPHVAQREVRAGHVDFVGLGRMVLSYPDLPLDVLRGRPLQRKKICRTFSDCTTAPRNDLLSGCYPLDPHYRALPDAARLRDVKQRARETLENT